MLKIHKTANKRRTNNASPSLKELFRKLTKEYKQKITTHETRKRTCTFTDKAKFPKALHKIDRGGK